MKTITIILLSILSFSTFAGDKVLNGGNAIVCRDSAKQITSVKVLDLYEVELAGGVVHFDPTKATWKEKLEAKFTEWSSVAPKRMKQYSDWLATFEQDAGFYTGINIPAIPDHGSVAIPKGCDLEPVGFQRPDSEMFPGVKRYVVNKDFWDRMDETHRAGLVLHELIYRESIPMKHVTSFPTRYFNGFLVSSFPDPEQYLRVAAKMPLSYIEYHGLVLAGASCIENEPCQPKVETYSSGNLKKFMVISHTASRVAFANVVFEEFSIRNVEFNFTPDGLVSFFSSSGSGYGSFYAKYFSIQIPSPTGRRDYKFTYTCDARLKPKIDCFDGFVLYPPTYPDGRIFLSYGKPWETLLFESPEARIKYGFPQYEKIVISDKVNFKLSDTSGFQGNLTAGVDNWVSLPGIGIIQEVTKITYPHYSSDEWTGIESTSGKWLKVSGVWIKQ